ncbi:MAG: hypothetical protein FJ011_01935 [Chloroflexi bacterium]|nr:hypothetical protein [Chloroflexota bacterium]
MLRQRNHFRTVVALCALFVILTIPAMLIYPGGTVNDPTTTSYSFFTNFFSDLGRTVTPAGKPNTTAMLLFTVALTSAGLGLAFFFIIFAGFLRLSKLGRGLLVIAALFGVASGVCFVGVAFTSANLYRSLHGEFVRWAFYLFLAAVLFCIPATLLAPAYPRRLALVFVAFALLLAGYIILLTTGPKASTPQGLLIQATGQKVIAYASVLTVLIQALGAQRLSGRIQADG